jgi:hypothetical protein
MSRTRRLGSLAAIAVIAIAIVGAIALPALAKDSAKVDRTAFHDAMRKLWEDHITWTRLYIVSAATLADDLPDLGATADRLLANQDDIGDAREHILGAATLIAAAKAGDSDAVAAASAAWYANADEIAAGLHALNPKEWPLDHMQSMMRAHLDRTLDEAVARLEGRYADDIAAYEAVHTDILAMADMLSDGIIAQFPGRVRG